MPWKTHNEHLKEQSENSEYAAAYAEINAELVREFRCVEDDTDQPIAEASPASPPVRNGTSRRPHTPKAGRTSRK